MMSAIDDEAQRIAQEVLESGIAALAEKGTSTEGVGESDAVAAVDTVLAAVEADLDDAVAILQEIQSDVDAALATGDTDATAKRESVGSPSDAANASEASAEAEAAARMAREAGLQPA